MHIRSTFSCFRRSGEETFSHGLLVNLMSRTTRMVTIWNHFIDIGHRSVQDDMSLMTRQASSNMILSPLLGRWYGWYHKPLNFFSLKRIFLNIASCWLSTRRAETPPCLSSRFRLVFSSARTAVTKGQANQRHALHTPCYPTSQ